MHVRRRTFDGAWMAGGLGTLLVTGAVAAGGTPSWERSAFEAVNGVSGILWPAAWAPMQFGTYVVTPLIALVAAVMRRGRLAVEILVAGSLGYLGAKLVKSLVERPRPGALFDAHLRGVGTTGGGFPSGHAATSAALAFVLFAWLPRRWGWSVVVLAVAVALLRVYTGAHLPLDVIGGAGLGVAAGALTTWMLGVPAGDADED